MIKVFFRKPIRFLKINGEWKLTKPHITEGVVIPSHKLEKNDKVIVKTIEGVYRMDKEKLYESKEMCLKCV